MEQKGIVCHIGEVTEVGNNGNKKQQVVIEYSEGTFNKKLAFQLFAKDIEGKFNTSRLAVGVEVNVKLNIDSTEWNGKYYTNCNCWAIEYLSDTIQHQPINNPPVETNDLPF